MDWPTGQDVNRQSRALLSVLLIGVVGLVAWRACPTTPNRENGGEIAISEAPTRGGTLRASLRNEPRTFNRVLDQGFAVVLISIITSSKLIRVNRATRALQPALVERWTNSPDNLTYTLTLRDGVTWSDGTPFPSADVLFTFQAIYDPRVPSVLASGLRVNGQPLKVTAPDPKTVVVTFPGTFGPGLALRDNVHLV